MHAMTDPVRPEGVPANVHFFADSGQWVAGAENILRSTGGATLGKLIPADMGIISVNAANSTETGNNDTTSLDEDIITIVHADYEVE